MDAPKHQNKEIIGVAGPELQGEEEAEAAKRQKQSASVSIESLPTSSSSHPCNDFSFRVSLDASTPVRSPDNFKTPPSFTSKLSSGDEDEILFRSRPLLPPHQIASAGDSGALKIPTSQARDVAGQHKLTGNRSNGSPRRREDTSYSTAAARKERSRPKSFVLRLAIWQKSSLENADSDEDSRKKKKMRLDVGGVLKKYMKLIQPLLWKREKEKDRRDIGRPPNCLSGHLSSKLKDKRVVGREGVSAPASLRTSPTNSGLLVAASPSNYSTMEELQNAVQAAIAHCKHSNAGKEDEIQHLPVSAP